MAMNFSEYYLKKSKVLSLPFDKESIDMGLRLGGINPAELVVDEVLRTHPLKKVADLAFMDLVYELLVSPDIREGDYSVTFQRDSIRDWYGTECSRLGIPNLLSRDTVKDMSFLS